MHMDTHPPAHIHAHEHLHVTIIVSVLVQCILMDERNGLAKLTLSTVCANAENAYARALHCIYT
jgi:hypothetical protein